MQALSETQPPARLLPRPITARPQNKWIHESNRHSEADRLLAAIIVLARRPQTQITRIALRRLVVKCSREIALES
jgi:hypothetical protein